MGKLIRESEWISVDDGLPDLDEIVLFFNVYKESFVGYREAFDQEGKVIRWVSCHDHLIQEEDVTHWMPLPEEPKDG